MNSTPEDWRTAISDVTDEGITYRGFALEDVLKQLDFASTAFLLFGGDPPSKSQSRVFNALLVAMADHGISPSQAVTRYVMAAGSPIQGAIAAGILTSGDTHGGAGYQAARTFTEQLDDHHENEVPELAEQLVSEHLADGTPVPGYGHPHHRNMDPRVQALVEISRDEELAGEYIELAVMVEEALETATGSRIPLNIDGISAAIVLELGFPPEFARPVVIMARVPGLIAHAIEESIREKGWRDVPGTIGYDGETNRTFDET
jgi:citrate synthase/citryl-CoA lyase